MRHMNLPALDNDHDRKHNAGRGPLLSVRAVGCGILLSCATWSAHAAAAEHLLYVLASNPNGCGPDPAGNTYFAEAWGYDAGGNIVCEAAEIMGSGYGIQLLGECHSLLGNAVTHAAAITTRNQNNTYAYVSTVVQSGRTSSWNTWSNLVTFTGPSSCGGGSMSAQSYGFDTSSN
jgi:hypothetical protein